VSKIHVYFQTFLRTPYFYNLVYTLKDAVFQGLSESDFIFVGLVINSAPLLKKVSLKIGHTFCIFIIFIHERYNLINSHI